MPHDSNGHIFVDRTASPALGNNIEQDIIDVVGGYDAVNHIYKPFLLGNINKWSKHKPIVFANKLRPLTDAEFEGDAAAKAAGIHYGIKLGESRIKGTMHTAVTFTYIRPQGIMMTEPHRILDFDGYYHNAMPSLRSAIPYPTTDPTHLHGYWDIETGLYVTIAQTNVSAVGGIDIAEMAGGADGLYPCALLTYTEDGESRHFCAALKNPNKHNTPTPLWYEDAKQEQFFIDFRSLDDIEPSIIPASGSLTGLKLSIFLTADNPLAPNHLELDGDFHEMPVVGDVEQFENTPFGTPDGMNHDLILDQLNEDAPMLTPLAPGVLVNGVSGFGSIAVGESHDDVYWKIDAWITQKGGGSIPGYNVVTTSGTAEYGNHVNMYIPLPNYGGTFQQFGVAPFSKWEFEIHIETFTKWNDGDDWTGATMFKTKFDCKYDPDNQ